LYYATSLTYRDKIVGAYWFLPTWDCYLHSTTPLLSTVCRCRG